MNKSDLEKCQDEYERILKENPFQSEIDRIAKDIYDRQDRVVMTEFVNTIAKLLKENGITVIYTADSYLKDSPDRSIESVYGVTFDRLDCAEHDKKFIDKIAELKNQISQLEFELSVKENQLKIKNGLCGDSDLSGLMPIEVAEKLINAESEYETNSDERALGAGEKRKYEIFSISDLRQIAEHLLVYCNHNSDYEQAFCDNKDI